MRSCTAAATCYAFSAIRTPDLEQARAILAAKIIAVLDRRKLSVRAAQALTGFAASEFSRIRNVRLARFTIDRMITILGKLDQDVELTVRVRPRRKPAAKRPARGVTKHRRCPAKLSIPSRAYARNLPCVPLHLSPVGRGGG